MLEKLKQIDRDIFFLINGNHDPIVDQVMYNVTATVFWLPLYVYMLYLLIKHFQKQVWLPLLVLVLVITVTDQTASALLKPLIERLRPTHDPTLAHLVHTVNGYRGGKFGFASSHAANTMGALVFLTLLFPRNKTMILILTAWCLLVSYSRIYLGVHFPSDVLGGYVIGIIAGSLGFAMLRMAQARLYPQSLSRTQ